MATHEHQIYAPYDYTFDVYLSFRGSDNRWNFAANLRHALNRKGFNIFMDDSEIMIGSSISLARLKALEGSRISIVVFSQDVASSPWCLDDLVQMLECRKATNQRIFPIYYRVDPSDVRHQKGSFGQAMASHGHRFGEGSVMLEIWKSALTEIASLVGYDAPRLDGSEFDLMEKIVETVTRALPLYDVFLSFYGEDTRYSFTGFLYQALRRKGVMAFMDDEGLVSGNQVSESLLKAIARSRRSIVVFSENFAYSTWCLDELVKIIECMETRSQLVFPIFYKIEKSDVSNQTNSYGDAMTKHEERFGKDSKEVQKWRSALSKVASWPEGSELHITGNEYEYEIIKRIVEMF